MNSNQKTSYKFLMVVSIALIMAIAVPTNAVLASTAGYLTIKTAVVNSASLDAVIPTDGIIPKDGSGGAFGYGIMTRAGDNTVLAVATTHQGVRDSVAQGSDSGPVWHTHFVQLGVGVTGLCGTNPEVQAITFQQPGRVVVVGSIAILQGIPSSFTGTDALTGNPLTLTPGHNVQNVVSFVLDPKFEGGALKAVCVED
ncbi:MAG: hypothetical protein WAM14_05975, partial [Candidatus Nitrosopolaris sp.]